MKERTVRARNFLGALLGGMLGILGFGYIHPLALPFGCFLGVVIGWWHQEIWMEISGKFSQGVAYWARLNEKAAGLVAVRIANSRKKEIMKPLLQKISKAVTFPYVFVRACARRIKSLVAEHPMNKAWLLSVSAQLLNFAIIMVMIHYFEAWVKDIHGKGLIHLTFFPIVCSLTAAMIFAGNATTKELGLKDMNRFYARWNYLLSHGSLRYFFKEVGETFYRIAFFFVFFISIATCYAIAGFVLLVVTALFCLIFGAVKGFYQAATKSGHWLCFGVTLVVTALSAWITFPWLGNKLWVWIIALATGLMSAAITEVVARLVVRYLERMTKLKQAISGSLAGYLESAAEYYVETGWELAKKTYERLPETVRN